MAYYRPHDPRDPNYDPLRHGPRPEPDEDGAYPPAAEEAEPDDGPLCGGCVRRLAVTPHRRCPGCGCDLCPACWGPDAAAENCDGCEEHAGKTPRK